MSKTSLSVLFSLVAGVGAAIACAPDSMSSPPNIQCCGPLTLWTMETCCEKLAEGTCSAPQVVTQTQCDNETFGQTGGPVTSGGAEPTDSDSQTLTLGEGPEDSGGVDESGGGECVPSEGTYNCHGWVAGVYKRKVTGAYGFAFTGSTGIVANAECFGGGDSVQITLPYQGAGENEYMLDACQTECERLVTEGQWTESDWSGSSVHDPNYWDYWKTICVVTDSAYNGSIPDDWEGMNAGPYSGFSEGCSWVGKSGDPLGDHSPRQVTYEGPAADDECAPAESCGLWNPGSKVSHSLSSTTHTTQFNAVFMAEIMAGRWRELYACDSGRYQQSIVSGVEKWKMFNLSSTGDELLYAMGFRSGDYEVKIRKSGTGQTTYTLSNYGAMAAAFDALWPGTTSFVVTFKRPGTGGIAVAHTMNLTFI